MPKHYKGRSHGGGSAPYSRSGVYNAYGQPVRNVESYAATGAPTYTSSGSRIRNPSAYTGAIEASYRQNTSTPKYLYHYTDGDSLGKIADSGRVKPSSGPGDCALGSGAYFTAKPPRSSTGGLLQNNYNGGGDASRVEGYVRVDTDRVNARSGRDELGRDVFVVPGGVNLSKANAKLGYR